MKKNELLFNIIVVLFVSLCFVYTGYNMFFRQRNLNVPNKNALKNIMNDINIGDSVDLVKKVYVKNKTESLEFNNKDPNFWTIGMPLEFGAGDWILFINFKDQVVKELRMRTSDGHENKPEGAPNDKK